MRETDAILSLERECIFHEEPHGVKIKSNRGIGDWFGPSPSPLFGSDDPFISVFLRLGFIGGSVFQRSCDGGVSVFLRVGKTSLLFFKSHKQSRHLTNDYIYTSITW